MLAVIGSVALSVHMDVGRKASDVDLVGDYDELIAFLKANNCTSIMPIDEGKKIVGRNKTTIFECEITWEGSTAQALHQLIANDPHTVISCEGEYIASLDLLYMLKLTHRYKKNSPHFQKNRNDIIAMRKAGATLRPEHEEFFKLREKATYNYGHPKLNQSKKDFFTDTVPYKYDHDSLHEAVKLYPHPAYTYYKEDTNEVMTSKDLFFKVTEDTRLAGVYEEACVLALERSQIPYPETPVKKSFDMALEKVCTSITSGWFREYAYDNYDRVQEVYDRETRLGYNYLSLFRKGLEWGVVKPFTGPTMSLAMA